MCYFVLILELCLIDSHLNNGNFALLSDFFVQVLLPTQ